MTHRKKRQILLVILILFVITIFIDQCASAEDVAVSIGDTAAYPGETRKVPVLLSSIQDYGTGLITVEYDPSVVQVTDVTGSEDSSVVAWNADNEAGKVKIAAWNINGTSGDIEFAAITFRASEKGGSTPLTIKVDELVTQGDGAQKNIEPRVINGSFTSRAKSTPGFGLLLVITVSGLIHFMRRRYYRFRIHRVKNLRR